MCCETLLEAEAQQQQLLTCVVNCVTFSTLTHFLQIRVRHSMFVAYTLLLCSAPYALSSTVASRCRALALGGARGLARPYEA